MGTSIHISPKSKKRNHPKKSEEKYLLITDALYVSDYNIELTFNSGEVKLIDFFPLFSRYVKGDTAKYFSVSLFKKFILKNGNIYWGKGEDVIFPVQLLYNSSFQSMNGNQKDEILYVF